METKATTNLFRFTTFRARQLVDIDRRVLGFIDHPSPANSPFIAAYIFIDNPSNPFPKWFGQRYYVDLNLPKAHTNGKWYQARTYYWLQENCEVKNKYVHEMVDGLATTYVFEEDSIKLFFSDNPTLLPTDEEQVPQLAPKY